MDGSGPILYKRLNLEAGGEIRKTIVSQTSKFRAQQQRLMLLESVDFEIIF